MKNTTRLISCLAAVALLAALALPLSAFVPKTVKFVLHDNGATIPDAQITAARQDKDETADFVYGGDGGDYYTAQLYAPGSGTTGNFYTIDVHHDRYESTQYILEVKMADTNIIIDADISAYRQCRVDVTVADQSGDPVGDVLVEIAGASGVTGGDGSCVIKARQDAAPVAVMVAPPGGYEYHGADMVAIDSDTAQLHLILEKSDAATVVIDLSGAPAADIAVGGDGRARITGRDADSGIGYNSFPLDTGTVVGVSGTGPLTVSGYNGLIHTENGTAITTLTGDARLYTPAGNTISIAELNSEIALSGPGHRNLGPVSGASHLYTVSGGTADFIGDYPGATVVEGGGVTVKSGVEIGDASSGTGTTVAGGSLILEGGAKIGGDLTVSSGGRLDLSDASPTLPVHFGGGAELILADGAVLLVPAGVAAVEDIQSLLQNTSVQLDASGSAVSVQTSDGRSYLLTGGSGGLELTQVAPGGGVTPGTKPGAAGASPGGSGSASAAAQRARQGITEADYRYNDSGDLVIFIPEPATRLGYVRAELLPGETTERSTKIPAGDVVVREVSGGVDVRLKQAYLNGLPDGPYAVRAVFVGGAFEIRFDLETKSNPQGSASAQQADGTVNQNPRTGP